MTTPEPPADQANPRLVMTRNLALRLPESFGPLLVDEELDYRTGRAYYTIVKATRASGTFTISGAGYGGQAIPTDSRIQPWRHRRPMVNGVTITDCNHYGELADWRTFTPRGNVNVYVRSGTDNRAPAPDKTRIRAGWIIIALLGRHFEHPDRTALLTAGAEHDALDYLEHVRRSADRLRTELADRQRETDRLTAELGRLDQLDLDLQVLAARYAQRTVAAGEYDREQVAP